MTRLLIDVAAAVAILTCGGTASGGTDVNELQRRFEEFHTAAQPQLVLSIMSAQTTARTSLTPEALDKRFAAAGPDYVLRVLSHARAASLAKLISSLQLTELGEDAGVDLRQRYEFSSGGKSLFTIYGDGADRLVYQGRSFEARPKNWTATMWRLMQDDFSYMSLP